MKIDSPVVRFSWGFGSLVAALALVAFGCGPSEEATEEWEQTPTVSPTAKLEFRVDSLQNENRRMKDQLDAVAAENRRLASKNSELETKLTEAATPHAGTETATAPPAVATGDVAGSYQAALAEVRKHNYAAAIDQFQAILNSGGTQYVDNSHYWMGESYYALHKYDDAIQHFQSVFEFKSSGKRPDAQLMIGNCQAAKGDKTAAKESYEKVISTYPTSAAVTKAKERLAKLK